MDDFKHAVINKGKYIVFSGRVAKLVFILGLMFIIGLNKLWAQTNPDSLQTDSVPAIEDSFAPDSLLNAAPDTLLFDASEEDASVINSKIDYSANDSIDNDVQNKKVYLYGNAVINYEDITLTAERIVYDFASYTVHAEGVQDTLGGWIGLPVFKQGDSQFESLEMDYNFKSKKAYVKQVKTEVIEGTLTGRQVKTTNDNKIIYVRKGEYCPCEDPNAKTRFKIGKLKVIKDEKIVTGPGYLALHNIPLPLAFPFGFFPNNEKKQAGLIIPSYGNAQQQGYFLNDLGFYLPIGDHIDTKILGDIYSRGSWGIQNITRYDYRYRFAGVFDIQYNDNVIGDRDLGNFSETTNFFVNWNHNQDPKAHPYSRFTASVSAGSTQNYRVNLNASQNDFLTNTFNSNIRYDRSFYNSPWSLSANVGHSQNSQTGNFRFTLPTLTANMATISPFDGLFNDNPKQQFYEKINIRYSGQFTNQLNVQEDELSLDNIEELRKKFQNGFDHNASVFTSLKAGPVSINPSFNYRERWYFRTFGRDFNPETQGFEIDTITEFNRNFDYSLNVNLTTKLYGMYSFRSGRVKAIRHTLTPSIGYSWRPDFDPNIYGFYGNDGTLDGFSPYQDAVFGGPPIGRQELITFNLINNIEAKVLSRRDTTSKFTKVAIIENISLNGNYNLALDSLNLSNISISGRTKITKYANINFNGRFDPYGQGVFTPNGGSPQIRDVDILLWERERKLARFEQGNIAVNAAGIGSSMFKKSKPTVDPVFEEGAEETDKAPLPVNKGFFEDFRVPWNLSFGYSVNARLVQTPIVLNEGFAINDSIALTQSLQFNGDFELFGRVRVAFNSGYDFEQKELTPTTFFVTVDLNCWEFSARVVPFGIRRSYNLSLYIKSSMLRDLKLERNRNLAGDESFFQ